MDMSDKIVGAEADELERDRELLRAEPHGPRPASFGHLASYSVGSKLKLMFGAAAGAAVLCDDLIDPAKNVESVGPRVLELMRDSAKRNALRNAMVKLGAADGARRVAEMLLRR